MSILHKKLCLLMFLLTGCSLGIFAQNRTITGTVRDAVDVVIGASVTVKGNSSIGTITDMDGKFRISVPSSARDLVIKFIGYDDAVIRLGTPTDYKVTLKESSVMLEEVVAIGYAKVKRKDLTGAISSVGGKELANVPVTTAMQALQGKAAGVNIVTESGAPGAGANITIRGGMSLTQSTEPLYIVDGFEMGSALDNIDINDIESIDVLKDASSTAIYGARGSNGIILITTKSGKKGKTQVSYNTYFSFDKLAKKLDLMSNVEDFVKYQYEFAELTGITPTWSAFYDDGMATDAAGFYTGVYDRIHERYADASSIDWQDEVFGGYAMTQSHNVNISTGTEKTQVMLSYNYNGQDGLLANHSANKSAFRAKINSELYKGIRLDVNAMFNNKSVDGGGSYSGMKYVLRQPISGGTYFTRDQMLTEQTYVDFRGAESSYTASNPLIQNEASTSNKRSRMFSVNAGLEFDFLKHFTYRIAGSYRWNSSKSTSFSDERSTGYLMDPVNTGMTGSIGNSESYSYQITNTLNYNQTFAKKHKVNLLLGHEVSYSEDESNSISVKQMPYPNHGIDDISLGNVEEKKSGHGHSGIVSAFLRANYTFDERYLLTATLRADGSSKFAKGHQWGVFPSASVAWRISEESFWKENRINDVVNSLKLRVGYGTTGNNGVGSFSYRTNVSLTSYPMNNVMTNPAYVLGTQLGNPELKWETQVATNVGLDVSLFNSRVNLTAEWYNNQANDLLLNCVVPSSTGYSTQYQNVGKMRNRGWEVTLNTVNIRTKNFSWTSDLNLSFNKSKVVALEQGQTEKTFSAGDSRSGMVTYYATVGEALGEMYGYKYEGIYTAEDFIEGKDGKLTLREGIVKPKSGTPQPGDIKYAADDVDEEGNPIFTKKNVKIGNGTPDCIGGFNNTFTYKGFDLSVFLKFAIGQDIYNANKQSLTTYSIFENIPQEFSNYYRVVDPSTGKQATLSRMQEMNPDGSARIWGLTKNNKEWGFYPSSYFVEDGSYLRLAQITLGYTLPKTWLKKAMISNARIYFTANNVATLTGYSGYDPEVRAAKDNVVTTPGYDSSAYPRSRSYVVGLNLTF